MLANLLSATAFWEGHCGPTRVAQFRKFVSENHWDLVTHKLCRGDFYLLHFFISRADIGFPLDLCPCPGPEQIVPVTLVLLPTEMVLIGHCPGALSWSDIIQVTPPPQLPTEIFNLDIIGHCPSWILS